MARSDDKKDDKRKPSPPRAEAGRKKEGRAKAAADGTPPAAAKKKAAAARPAPKAPKAAAPSPRARRTPPPSAEGLGKAKAGKVKAAAARPASAKPASAKPASAKPASAKPASAKPASAKPATTRPPTSAKTRAAAKPAASKPPVAKTGAPRKRASVARPEGRGPAAPSVLDEEERIEDAKYQPRHLPRRLFEEERFIFPDSYGQSRIRLLVKDPDWLFAHWDIDPQSLADLRAELGERASALSTFTLRVSDPRHGGETRVLLPDGARSCYVRADTRQRTYVAELGLTLPSGEFRSLAQSNVVTTPRTGPARTGGPRRMRYDGVTPPASEAPAGSTSGPAAQSAPADPGPWSPDPSTTSYPGPMGRGERAADERGPGRRGEPSGGASDVYRR